MARSADVDDPTLHGRLAAVFHNVETSKNSSQVFLNTFCVRIWTTPVPALSTRGGTAHHWFLHNAPNATKFETNVAKARARIDYGVYPTSDVSGF